jgi:hypothetical protein
VEAKVKQHPYNPTNYWTCYRTITEMNRQIVMTEQELDVMLNRAFASGVGAENRKPGLLKAYGLAAFQAERDRARNELKEYSFK